MKRQLGNVTKAGWLEIEMEGWKTNVQAEHKSTSTAAKVCVYLLDKPQSAWNKWATGVWAATGNQSQSIPGETAG